MIALRLVAAALAVLGVLPLWRFLPQLPTGLAGVATAEAASSYSALIWNGVLIALIPALLCAFLLDNNSLERVLRRLTEPLARPRAMLYAGTLALLTAVLAFFVAFDIFHGRPAFIDSFAQLLQARYLASGTWSGPVQPFQEFWHIQQTIITKHGWVSQYPPGTIALLAVGFIAGTPALVGPVMLAVAAFFTTLVADLIIENRVIARVAALLAALSPFMLALSGAFMSHVPAAAFSVAALYFVLRAEQGNAAWSLAAGAAIGALFTIRPLTAVVAGIVAVLFASATEIPGNKVARVAAAAGGALPFLVLVALYNHHFFGHATTFGYNAALGPNAGLGFGTDPWGNSFGIVEALGYTSAELAALNVHLLETPLPLVLFVGLWFALWPPQSPRVRLLFWWVAGLVIASLFYWHHGLYMGPRMLADNGPLWVLLVVTSTAGLIARIRADWLIAEKYSVRAFATGGVIATLLAGLLLFAPERIFSYTPTPEADRLLTAPTSASPAIVFVHGGWTSRVAMRMAGHGMRLDSVETALRQNSTCAAHHYALAFASGRQPNLHLDFVPRSDVRLRALQLAPGDRIVVATGEKIDAGCAAEMASDTAGIIDITAYLWQSDLPGLAPKGALFARDMGPLDNARLIAAQPGRTPLMLVEHGNGFALEPYEAAVRRLWPATAWRP